MSKKKRYKQKTNDDPVDIKLPVVNKATSHLWTDGSHRPPDNASCAFLVFSERTKEITKIARMAFRGKTINQMELEAIHHGLDYAGDYVIIYTDSMYALSALTLWYRSWEKNNWMTPLNEPVKNKELIQSILSKMAKKKFVRFIKVKAHVGEPFNSIVDYLAQKLSYKMRDDASLPDGYHPL